MKRSERLAEVYRRLRELPHPSTPEEAMDQLRTTMNELEDQYSGVPFDPRTMGRDGRLYPPMEDARKKVEGRKGERRYRTRGHNVYVQADGGLRIERIRTGEVEFERVGAGGGEVNSEHEP